MMSTVFVVIIAVSLASYAEWRHFKSGNGKRFESIHKLLSEYTHL